MKEVTDKKIENVEGKEIVKSHSRKEQSTEKSDGSKLTILAKKGDSAISRVIPTYKQEKNFSISKLKPNPINEITNSILTEQYANETAYWNRYEIPLIKEDGTVLRHWEDVLAARANGLKQMDVIMVLNLNEHESIRYINFSLYFKRLSYLQRFTLISELEEYIKNTEEGKAWRTKLQAGREKFDINSLLGLITGFHKESIKLYKRIGQRGKQFFDEKKTLELMYHDATVSVPKKAASKTNLPEPKVDFKMGKIQLSIGGNSYELNDTDAIFKNNILSYQLKIDDLNIILTLKNFNQ